MSRQPIPGANKKVGVIYNSNGNPLNSASLALRELFKDAGSGEYIKFTTPPLQKLIFDQDAPYRNLITGVTMMGCYVTLDADLMTQEQINYLLIAKEALVKVNELFSKLGFSEIGLFALLSRVKYGLLYSTPPLLSLDDLRRIIFNIDFGDYSKRACRCDTPHHVILSLIYGAAY